MKARKNTIFFSFYFFTIEVNKRKFEPVSFFFVGEKQKSRENAKKMEMPLSPQLLPQRMGFAYFVHKNK